MSSETSPLTRLLRLEQAVEQLVAANLPQVLRNASKQPTPSRAIWPADQLLLTRILRRTPEILTAYQAPAQLLRSKDRGVHLSISEETSVFQFCELIGGDAVVWVSPDSPDWVWQSESFRSIFGFPSTSDLFPKLVLQGLPLFKPISSGETWVLYQRGEMVVQVRPFPEHSDKINLLRRLESLERQVGQRNSKIDSSIQELRAQLRVQQGQIDQLLRLFPDS